MAAPLNLQEIITKHFISYDPNNYEEMFLFFQKEGIPLKIIASPADYGFVEPNVSRRNPPKSWVSCYGYVTLELFNQRTNFKEARQLLNYSTEFVSRDESEAKENDIVIYTNPDLFTKKSLDLVQQEYAISGLHHWGIYKGNGIVESKWGFPGPVIQHPVDLIPSYWDGIKSFYRKK